MNPVLIDLSKNEFPFTHPLDMREFFKNINSATFSRYKFDSILQDAIAKQNGVPSRYIFLFNGAEQALKNIFLHLKKVRHGSRLALPDMGWDHYFTMAKDCNVRIRHYSYERRKLEFSLNKKSVTHLLNEKVDALLIGSPVNPLGSSISHKDQVSFSRKLMPKGFIIIDETYRGFANDKHSTKQKIHDMPNSIIVRSFSKFYGLAGMRIGYVVCGETAREFMEHCRVYLGMNTLAEMLGMMCIKKHKEFVKYATTVKNERKKLIQFFNTQSSCRSYTSEANFVLVEFSSSDLAENYTKFLLKEGIKIKKMAHTELQRCVRISIGTPRQMKYLRDTTLSFFAVNTPAHKAKRV